MKIKKEITKKIKIAPKKKAMAAGKKVASKVRTVSATKKVVKKTKIAGAPKRKIKKTKTIAASKFSYEKMLADSSLMKLGRKEIKFNLKRVTYVVLSLVVGILISGFVVGLLEMIYLKNSLKLGVFPSSHEFLGMHLFLFPAVYVTMFVAGLVFGAWLGSWGWRVVYIEKRHRMFQR